MRNTYLFRLSDTCSEFDVSPSSSDSEWSLLDGLRLRSARVSNNGVAGDWSITNYGENI